MLTTDSVLYKISLPSLQAGVANFTFNARIDNGQWVFLFQCFDNISWSCFITLPNGEVREAGVYPNIINWLNFPDYGIMFISSLSSIGLNDLYSGGVYIYVVAW